MGRKNHTDDDDDFREELGPFFDSSDPDDDDDDDDDEEAPTRYQIDQEARLELMQMDLVEMDLNQRILKQAIRYCEKSFWWRFLGDKARQERIDRAYTSFRRLVRFDEPEE